MRVRWYLSTRAQSVEHWIRLNVEFRSDLAWWTLFVDRWNGVSMLSTSFVQVQPHIRVFTQGTSPGGNGLCHIGKAVGATVGACVQRQ